MKKEKKIIFSILFITCIGLLFRAYKITKGLPGIDYDEAKHNVLQQYFVIKKLCIPLISSTRITHGVLGLYTESIIYFFLGFSHLSLRTIPLIFYLLEMGLLFYFIKKEYNVRTAIITTSLFSTSNYYILSHRITNSGGIQPFISLLYYIAFFNFLKKNNKKNAFLLGLISGTTIQFHPTYTFMLISSFLYLIIEKKIKKFKQKQILFFIIGMSIVNIPLIVYQFKTPPPIISEIFRYGGKERKASSLNRMNLIIEILKNIGGPHAIFSYLHDHRPPATFLNFRYYLILVYPLRILYLINYNLFTLFFFVLLFFFLFTKKIDMICRFYLINILTYLIIFFLFLPWSNWKYFSEIAFSMIILLSIFLGKLLNKNKRLALILIFLLILQNISGIVEAYNFYEKYDFIPRFTRQRDNVARYVLNSSSKTSLIYTDLHERIAAEVLFQKENRAIVPLNKINISSFINEGVRDIYIVLGPYANYSIQKKALKTFKTREEYNDIYVFLFKASKKLYYVETDEGFLLKNNFFRISLQDTNLIIETFNLQKGIIFTKENLWHKQAVFSLQGNVKDHNLINNNTLKIDLNNSSIKLFIEDNNLLFKTENSTLLKIKLYSLVPEKIKFLDEPSVRILSKEIDENLGNNFIIKNDDRLESEMKFNTTCSIEKNILNCLNEDTIFLSYVI